MMQGMGWKVVLRDSPRDNGRWMIVCKRLTAWFGNLGRERMNFSQTPFNL